jgi:hypothetical protein
MGVNIMTKKNSKEQKEKLLSNAEQAIKEVNDLDQTDKTAIKTGLTDALHAGDSAPIGAHLSWKESIKLFFHNIPAKFMALFKATAPIAIPAGEKALDNVIDASHQPPGVKELEKTALHKAGAALLTKIENSRTTDNSTSLTSANLTSVDITDATGSSKDQSIHPSNTTTQTVNNVPVIVTVTDTSTVTTTADNTQTPALPVISTHTQNVTTTETDPMVITPDNNANTAATTVNATSITIPVAQINNNVSAANVVTQTSEPTYVAPVEDNTQTFAQAIGQVIEHSSAMMI